MSLSCDTVELWHCRAQRSSPNWNSIPRTPRVDCDCHCHYCHVMSCHVMSCHVMSMSCHVIFLSCHVMSCHVMSCHVMSCHVMSQSSTVVILESVTSRSIFFLIFAKPFTRVIVSRLSHTVVNCVTFRIVHLSGHMVEWTWHAILGVRSTDRFPYIFFILCWYGFSLMGNICENILPLQYVSMSLACRYHVMC